MRLRFGQTAQDGAEDAALSVRAGVGERVGGIVPKGAPEYSGIRRHDVEEIDALINGERRIEAARNIVIERGQTRNDLGTGNTDTVNSTEYFAQQRIFAVGFGYIAGT